MTSQLYWFPLPAGGRPLTQVARTGHLYWLVHPLHYTATTGFPLLLLGAGRVYSTDEAGTQNHYWAVGKVAAKYYTIQ